MDELVADVEQLKADVGEFLETFSYENIVSEIEKDDNYTYVEELTFNGYTIVTVRDNDGYEYLLAFNELGTLCEYCMK